MLTTLRKFDPSTGLLQEDERRKAEEEAASLERDMALAILAALLLLRRRKQVSALIVVSFDWDGFEQALSRALVPGFAIHDLAAATVSGFDPLDPATIQRQQDYRATFLKEFVAETKKAADMAYQWAVRKGLDPEAAVVLVRTVAGLNVRQTGAVLTQWASRIEAANEPGTPWKVPPVTWKMLEKAVEKVSKERAKTTADSEGWRLFSLGEWSALDQQARQGVTFRRFWDVTPDERLCPVCSAIPGMNARGVALDEPFRTPAGNVMIPPQHPRCRCRVRVEVVQ